MLRKLMKYEIRSMGRLLLPLYVVLLAASAAFGILFRIQLTSNPVLNLILRRFQQILVIVFVVAVVLTGVVMGLLLIQRFYKSLLGQEGYLMFTLPVTTAQNIWSKALTSLLWIVLGGVTGALCGLIMITLSLDLNSFLQQLGEIWNELLTIIGNGNNVATGIMLVVAMLLGTLRTIMGIYAGFSIGHQWNDHRILGSVIAFVVFMIIEVIIIQLPFVGDFMNTLPINSALSELIVMAIIEAVRTAIFYGITWFMLDKRLNLE